MKPRPKLHHEINRDNYLKRYGGVLQCKASVRRDLFGLNLNGNFETPDEEESRVRFEVSV